MWGDIRENEIEKTVRTQPDPARLLSVKREDSEDQPDLSQYVESRLQVKMNSPDSSRDIAIKQEKPEDNSHLDIPHMVVCKEEFSPKRERSPALLQEKLEPPRIKEEEEELLIRPEEPAGSMLTLLAVKSEDGDEDISSCSSEVEVEVELESESESEIEFESDTEVTEDSDDLDETSGGQSASNNSSITRKNQGDTGEPRSYSHLNCAQSVQKNIFIINTPLQMRDASANGPINVIYANALGSSYVPVINIPLVLAYSGYQYGRLYRPSEGQQVTMTTYKQQQLQTQEKAKHTIDVPIVSQHQSSREVCKQCRKRFLHLNKHLSKSPPCRSYYDIHSLKKRVDKSLTYRQRLLQLQQCQSKSGNNEPILELPILQLCNQCLNRFKHLNMHLSKSPPCKTYYDKSLHIRNIKHKIIKPI